MKAGWGAIRSSLGSAEPDLADLLVAFVIVTSAVMVIQVACASFAPLSAAFWSLMVCGVLGLLFVRRVAWPASRRPMWATCMVGLAVVMLRWGPFLHTEGGQDQGIYIAMSAHLGRTHGLEIRDAVREALPEAQQTEYDQLNNRHHVTLPQRSEGWHQPGIYIRDLTRSTYVFQFYALHPMWMSLSASLLGDANRVYSLVFLSALSVLMLSLLAYELSGRRPLAGFLAAGLLAVNPMHVFLSRFPVTENVTLFFTAAALYYLVRYFKGRDAGGGAPWHLAMSGGAWAGAFFTHLAGFMYPPIVLPILLAGIATSKTIREMRHVFVYGVGVAMAYGLSLAFAMRWSLPYSYDIYRTLFGEAVGRFAIDYWWVVAAAMVISFTALAALAWAMRAPIGRLADSRLARLTGTILALSVFALLVYGLYQGYRLGFTDHFASDEWIGKRWELSRTGWPGFLHSAVVVLLFYVSPVVVVFCVATLWIRRRAMNAYETALVGFLTYFLVVRTAVEGVTPYYFYGRYLAVELVPFLIVLAAVWLADLVQRSPSRKWLAGGVLGLALAWEALALAPQYPGGDMYRVDAGLRPIADMVREKDLLIFAGGEYPALQTAMEYYYGKKTVKVDPAKLAAAVRQYSGAWADIYVLSTSDNLVNATYLGAFTVWHDHYQREGALNILPMNSMPRREGRFHLYRVNRPDLSRLRVGDAIDFASGGNLRQFLGSGWSNQEKFMRWTEGPAASLSLTFAESPTPVLLKFQLMSHNCVPVGVKVNGEVRARWTFSECNKFVERQLAVKREDLQASRPSADLTGGRVTVTFEHPDVKAPREVNPASGDGRKLGIAVTRIDIESP